MKNTTTTRKATPEQLAQVKAENDFYRTATAHTHGKTTATATPKTKTSKTESKTQGQTTNKKAFADMLRKYEKAVNGETTATEYENILIDLAQAVAYSVLKKCINVSYNETLVKTRKNLTRDLHELATLETVKQTATKTEYNESGDRITVIADKQANEKYNQLISLSLGDGLDLRNESIKAIQEQTAQALVRNNGTLESGWIEKPFTIRKLNKKVRIKSSESVGGWIDYETTPIKEIYVCVRRYIMDNRTVNADPRNSYIYISELITDDESGQTDTIYNRYAKYADIGGYVTDFNGKPTTYTASEQTAKDIDKIISSLNLSTQQAKIIELRMCGYGYKAIAKYLGVKPANIQTQVKRIQAKAVEIGLTASTTKTTETE